MLLCNYYCSWHKRGDSKFELFRFSSTFNAVFCKVFILMDYWWTIKIICYFILKMGSNSEILHIWKVYRIVDPMLMRCFVIERIVLRNVFGVCRRISSIFTVSIINITTIYKKKINNQFSKVEHVNSIFCRNKLWNISYLNCLV